ncbi:VOC family protein [Roseobacter sp. YSTF-M11]|uniref:VOC family protein n=1 Tax=Roseobacter insulae TaxID=2859783 RepID=A0A9X1FXF0_9RHOB|nr:VOC family protein [Roseobacter insulae]MBW4709432.1 VOC family protein [Roseobacter insulae]
MHQSEIQCRVRALDHLVLTVASIPETVRFYTQVLGMRGEQFEATDGTRRWSLLFGQSKINLHQKGREFDPKAAHAHPGTADICLLTDAPLEAWIVHLTTHQVEIEEGPVQRTGARGPITSLYLRDPDKNLIEVSVPAY